MGLSLVRPPFPFLYFYRIACTVEAKKFAIGSGEKLVCICTYNQDFGAPLCSSALAVQPPRCFRRSAK